MQKKYLKAISALMCTAMCVSLAACGSGGGSDEGGSGSGSSGSG